MNRRSNNFLENLKRARAAKEQKPEQKPVSEMSPEELDAEEARLRAELRRSKEQIVEATRQELQGRSRKRPLFKRSRPSWK